VKLAVVTPRYGIDVGGGAETAARLLAEALVVRAGWEVDVLTTTAIDVAWNDGDAPAAETLGGVHVRRFPIRARRAPDFDERSARLLPAPRRATVRAQQQWLVAQGPVSDALLDAIAASDADVVALHPYLYHPTVEGARVARAPVVLHPAAHDEAPLTLAMYRDLFTNVDGLAFWSDAERALVLDRFPVGATPQAVVGLGVEPGSGDPDVAAAALGIADPYLLCLGRVDDGKGAALLARLFAEYAGRHNDGLRLVFAGQLVDRPPVHDRIVLAGPVGDSTKWGLLRGARALVSPSAFESFGIVLVEAWSVGTPVLVNARCAVTTAHTRAACGGLAFHDFATFEVALERLGAGDGVGAALGAAGRRHVAEHDTWDAVLARYERLLHQVIARG
jgi:glycosyltransferase involved in cell wall biosynthesis